jgi:hypothetical protein
VSEPTRTTVYRAAGSLSSGRLRARLGRFENFNLAFKPTRVLPVERPGCDAITSQFELGGFTGSIRFRGERGHVSANPSRARGEVVNSVRYDCADPPPSVRHSSHRTLDETVSALNRLDQESERDHRALLDVRNGKLDGDRTLIAIAKRHRGAIGPTSFIGGSVERLGAVRIFRVGPSRRRLLPFSSTLPPAPRP